MYAKKKVTYKQAAMPATPLAPVPLGELKQVSAIAVQIFQGSSVLSLNVVLRMAQNCSPKNVVRRLNNFFSFM
jgi:hypothetical protein